MSTIFNRAESAARQAAQAEENWDSPSVSDSDGSDSEVSSEEEGAFPDVPAKVPTNNLVGTTPHPHPHPSPILENTSPMNGPSDFNSSSREQVVPTKLEQYENVQVINGSIEIEESEESEEEEEEEEEERPPPKRPRTGQNRFSSASSSASSSSSSSSSSSASSFSSNGTGKRKRNQNNNNKNNMKANATATAKKRRIVFLKKSPPSFANTSPSNILRRDKALLKSREENKVKNANHYLYYLISLNMIPLTRILYLSSSSFWFRQMAKHIQRCISLFGCDGQMEALVKS
jgi:hypothetical protein